MINAPSDFVRPKFGVRAVKVLIKLFQKFAGFGAAPQGLKTAFLFDSFFFAPPVAKEKAGKAFRYLYFDCQLSMLCYYIIEVKTNTPLNSKMP